MRRIVLLAAATLAGCGQAAPPGVATVSPSGPPQSAPPPGRSVAGYPGSPGAPPRREDVPWVERADVDETSPLLAGEPVVIVEALTKDDAPKGTRAIVVEDKPSLDDGDRPILHPARGVIVRVGKTERPYLRYQLARPGR